MRVYNQRPKGAIAREIFPWTEGLQIMWDAC